MTPVRLVTIAATAGGLVAVTIGLVAQGVAPTKAEPSDQFQQLAVVFQHPRCLNCHTTTGFPKQGNDRHRHAVNVARGPDGHGAPGFTCTTCHGQRNNDQSGVPGANEDWHLAPLSMAWEGLTAGELCHSLKDPAKNGGRTGAKIIEHLNTNLVRWAWAPGVNAKGERRDPPPRTHDDFVARMEDWIQSGGACPES